jgi:hypothetical protein
MSQWKFVIIALVALGTTSAAAVGLAGGGGSQDGSGEGRGAATGAAAAQNPPEKKEAPPAVKKLPEPVDVMLPKQMERRRAAAAQRVDAQRAYYEEGRITIDRFIQALQLFNEAEMESAKTGEQRIIAAQNHMERLSQVLKREQGELEAGRGTVADVAEAQLAHELAAIELLKAHKAAGSGEEEALQKRVEELEKQLEQVTKQLERAKREIR